MPSRDEFAAWLTVEWWLAKVAVAAVAVAVVGRAVWPTLTARVGRTVAALLALWGALVVVSLWYVGRIADE